MFEEFQVYINSIADDEYLIRTEKAESGVPIAEERVQWSVETWLNQSRVLFHDPLVKLLQNNGNARYIQEPKSSLMISPGDALDKSPDLTGLELKYADLGLSLYNAVFTKSVKDSLIAAKGIANHNRSILRLRLGSRDERILSLPWELMMEQESPGQNRLVSTGPEIIFSRYQERSSPGNSNIFKNLNPERPLRILMAIAGPDDQENLQLKTEAAYIREELQSQRNDGSPAIELDILEQPSREELIEAIEQKHYQVFHYSGHSNASRGGNLYLVSKSTGLTETLRGEELAGLLANNGIQLVVLNSCNSGDDISLMNTNDSSLSRILIKRRIPAVIAMAAKIPDQVALVLTRILYRNLNMGYPIDFCLTRARQGLLSAYGAQQMYWALPILYLDPLFDGLLVNNDPIGNDYNVQSYDVTVEDKSLSLQEQLILMASAEAEKLSKTMAALDPQGAEQYADATGLGAQDTLHPMALGAVMELEEGGDRDRPEQEPQDSTAASLFADLKAEVEARESSSLMLSGDGSKDIVPSNRFSYQSLERAWSKQAAKRKAIGGGAVLLIVGVISLGIWQKLTSVPFNADKLNLPPSEIEALSHQGDGFSLATVGTNLVTELAITELEKGNIEKGTDSVMTLLDRGALSQAQAALSIVPLADIDQPEINFARGRLAWEAVKTKNENYALNDVRRFWQAAVRANPDNPSYLHALGWVYYSEHAYDEAVNTWYEAISLMQAQPTQYHNSEVLHAYAGLALIFKEMSEDDSNQNQEILADKAMEIYAMVNREQPEAFQPEALGKNWFWSEEAITKWKNFHQPSS